MYIIFFALLFCGMVFHEILGPICEFLSQNSILVFVLCGVGLALYCARVAKKIGQPEYGFSSFFAVSQFLVFALTVLFAIVGMMNEEEDPVLSMIITLIVGAVFGVYGGFNLTMVKSALTEGRENKAYPWIVGAVGWAINIAFVLLN